MALRSCSGNLCDKMAFDGGESMKLNVIGLISKILASHNGYEHQRNQFECEKVG
jgi:hypothetical protein